MAPFISLFALFALALATTALASPHISRNVHNHAHRAVPRALNRRCNPRPSNSTTSALPTTTPPINVAPVPASFLPSSSSSTSSYVPPTSPYVPPTSAYVPSTSPYVPSTSPYVPPTSSHVQTTSQAPTPTPTTTSTPPPPPTTSSPPPPAQTSSSSSTTSEPSYYTGTQYGDGTWYEVGLGACGITNSDDQLIVAVSESLFDGYPGYDGINPNTNPVCGRTITLNYQGNSVTVTVRDRCVGCSATSLDLSPTAFTKLASESVGRISMDWTWSS